MSSGHNNNGATINMRYSAFLGIMYPATTEYNNAVDAAKALVGDAAVKAGFTGKTGDSATARAIDSIAKLKLSTENPVSGRLTSVSIRMKGVAGKEQPYLQIGLRDDEKRVRYMLSLPTTGASIPTLVRKLAACQPDQATKISMFALYEKGNDGRMYGNHYVSVSQNGAKVAGLGLDDLIERQKNSVAALKAIKMDSKDLVKKAKEQAVADYVAEQVKAIEERFTAHYEAKYSQPN